LPDSPKRFGHHTVSLRAQFTPDGAAPSLTNSTALASPNQVMIPAALVPEGTSAPGYPFEHIAQAQFTPDPDDISNSTRTNRQRSRSGEALMGMLRDTPTPGNNVQRSPRQFAAAAASAPRFGAPAASDASSNTEAPAPTPRRSVRSAQANFSAAAPQPHRDNSRDAIDAAVNIISVMRPSLDRSAKPVAVSGASKNHFTRASVV
jgi:hypothetical protein